MTTVHLEIRPDVVVVRIPARAFSAAIPNEITVRDRKIIGVGGAGVRGTAASREPRAVTTPAFDAAQFDVDLATAFTRWALNRALNQARVPWWRRLSAPRLALAWSAWAWIPIDRRRAFLGLHERQRVDINGRPAIRPRIDLPILRGLLGNGIDPGL